MVTVICALLVFANNPARAQEVHVFEAVATTGQEPGMKLHLQLIIDGYSPVEDQQILIESFGRHGNAGLIAALKTVPVRGKLWVSNGTRWLLYDIGYARQVQNAEGSREIQAITSGVIPYSTTETDSKSLSDIEIAAVQLTLVAEGGKSTGTLAPRCALSFDKEKEIHIVVDKHVWRLESIVDRSGKRDH